MKLKNCIAAALALACLALPALAVETRYVCDLEEGSSFLQDMTMAPLSELCTVTDVTGEYRDVPRGYGFRLDLKGITAQEVLDAISQAEWLSRAESETPGEIITLAEAGFSTIGQAQEAGHRRFYLDTAGFWGLEAGWLPIDSCQKLRDEAMSSGVLEYYVNPAYLYRNYLAPGTGYHRWQGEFLGLCLEEPPAEPEVIQLSQDQLVLFTAEATAPSALALELSRFYFSCGPYRAETLDNGQIRLSRNEAYPGTRAQDYPDTILCRPAP